MSNARLRIFPSREGQIKVIEVQHRAVRAHVVSRLACSHASTSMRLYARVMQVEFILALVLFVVRFVKVGFAERVARGLVMQFILIWNVQAIQSVCYNC